MKKLKKFLKLFITAGIFVSPVFYLFASSTSIIKQFKNNNEEFASLNFSSEKFAINNWNFSVKNTIDEDLKQYINEANKSIELKIYLDIYRETGNLEQRINTLVNKIKYEFKNSNINWKVETSKMLPIAWFYFDNVEQASNFVKTIDKLDYVSRIVFYKKNAMVSNWYPQYIGSELNCDLYPGKCVETGELHSVSALLRGNYNSETKVETTDKTIKKEEYFERTQIDNQSIFTDINFTKKKQQEVENNSKISNVGVLEYYYGTINNFHTFFKKPKIFDTSKELSIDDHGLLVSSIIGGNKGIGKKAQVFYSYFTSKNSTWQRSLEWLVLDNNVRIINHSYGSAESYPIDYNDKSFFIDYIARRYGVVNVFSSGNGYDKTEGQWIDERKLSSNSIVVGATEPRENRNKPIQITPFSNRTLHPKFPNLPKPLVVAPGEIKFQGGAKRGTSYSAPIVTASLANLLKLFPNLDNDEFRVPISMVILAASSQLPKNYNLSNLNSNGFDHTYGAGLIDFEKMVEAAKNVQTFSISEKNVNKDLFNINNIWLNKNDEINVSIAWLFNAGILKRSEPEFTDEDINFLLDSKKSTKSDSTDKKIELLELKKKKWRSTHIDNTRLTQSATLKKQNDNWFSDLDMYLEKWENGSWKEVKKSVATKTNVELIKFKITQPGTYRIRIRQYSSVLFENSVKDIGAITYTIKRG
ncbi:S8 family serine peptidase [Mycoplasma sp. 1654_15]|uniref:S8 family serine peptidase n=1 Tax=Mycoplasma sp. 1654_15 TaxID=2725994 RepID=UPI001449E11D|nr:S8 family serine peptidase [Mycoplasma sp. 1654_15]QJB71046.1 S8 family serine peptidase [Mycoplasma sp. 1654_15]